MNDAGRRARPTSPLLRQRLWKDTIKLRKTRAGRIVAYLKKAYPEPKSELHYRTPIQFVVAVILSAQCTDKAVNRLTDTLFKKYKTARDFAKADPEMFTKEISSIPFFRNKAKAIMAAAKKGAQDFCG